jgi:hypothetical protein
MRAIGDLDYDDSLNAVAAHYGETTERVMPGHVRTRVKAMRRDRLERTPLPAPAPALTDDPPRYRESLAASITSIADGRQVRRAIAPAGPSGLPADQAEALKARLGKAAPKLTPQEIAAQQAAESRAEREAADRKEAS